MKRWMLFLSVALVSGNACASGWFKPHTNAPPVVTNSPPVVTNQPPHSPPPVVTNPPPSIPTWPEFKFVKVFESPKDFNVTALAAVAGDVLVTVYRNQPPDARNDSRIYRLSDGRKPILKIKAETIQAPVEFDGKLYFPIEQSGERIPVMDRKTLAVSYTVKTPKGICLAGVVWKGQPIMAASKLSGGSSTLFNAITGASVGEIRPSGGVIEFFREDDNTWLAALDFQDKQIVRSDGRSYRVPAVCFAKGGELLAGTSTGEIWRFQDGDFKLLVKLPVAKTHRMFYDAKYDKYFVACSSPEVLVILDGKTGEYRTSSKIMALGSFGTIVNRCNGVLYWGTKVNDIGTVWRMEERVP